MTREELLSQLVRNPLTQRDVTVRYALKLPKDHPAYRAAAALVQKSAKKADDAPTPSRSKQKKPITTERMALLTVKVSQVNGEPAARGSGVLRRHGEKYLHGTSPLDITAVYLSSLGVTNESQVDVVEIDVTDESSEGGHPEVRIHIELKDGTTLTRYIKTSRKRKNSVIVNAHFELGYEVQRGGGRARQMLADTIKIADQINATAVLFSAGLDAGGYVWAKYGAIPDPKSRIDVYQTLLDRIKHGGNDEDARSLKYLQNTIKEYQKMLKTATKGGKMYDYYRETIADYERQIENRMKQEELFKKHRAEIALIRKLIEAEVKKLPRNIDGQYMSQQERHVIGSKLSRNLLAYIATTQFGKALLLQTEWDGYFDMREGSLGREMLEKALRAKK